MLTKCPSCETVFDVSTEELHQAKGIVRCGNCSTIFSSVMESLEKRENKKDKNIANWLVKEVKKKDYLDSVISGRMVMILMVMVGLVMLQLIILNYRAILNHSPTRDVLGQVCSYLNCTIPQTKNLNKLAIVSQRLSISREDELLTVFVNIYNKADFVQTVPTIQISLSNLIGEQIAYGLFTPEEYLPYQSNQSQLIASDQYRQFNFSLREPSKRIRDLQIDLL